MVWLFGYGSLIWKIGFPYVDKKPGYVKGFVRRFYWWSLDHRGVPGTYSRFLLVRICFETTVSGAPGRVVNLLRTGSDEDVVWGMAYEIDDEVWEEKVRQQLDHREKGGYQQNIVRYYSKDGNQFDVIAYVGDLSDKQYAGPAPLEDMADTIYRSEGPSGLNKDYLYNLAASLRDVIGVDDQHVFELEEAVRKLDQN